VAERGEGDAACQKFKAYFSSLCPSEWVAAWEEQRSNGTFPGKY
jgi:cytochrome c oxidase subunit 6b